MKIPQKELRGGVGSGGRVWGGGCQGRCERRIEVFVKIQKKIGGGGVEGASGRVGGSGGCERRIEVFVKIQQKKIEIGLWGSGWM